MVIRLLAVGVLCACGDDPCPRGPMTEGLGGLVVTEEEHPTGWGEPTCASCHAFDALHRMGCTPEVDLVAAQDRVEQDGEASCAECHGTNGVPMNTAGGTE